MYKTLVVLCVLAATALFALARPSDTKTSFLSDVMNKTMCPIKVVIDDNPDRIPRRIKHLKCDEHPEKICEQHQLTHGCCRRHHHNFILECVELYDWVQVMYKGEAEPSTIKVPVGCSCLIQETTTAKEVP